jgi:hypothetical protein
VLIGEQRLEISSDGGGDGRGLGFTQAREGNDRAFDIGWPHWSVCDFDKRSIRLGEEAFDRQRSDCGAMFVVFEHLGIDREVASKIESAMRLGLGAGEPVQDGLATRRGQVRFEHVEDHTGSSHAMNGENLPAGRRAGVQDALEHLFLRIEGAIEARTGVEADFADIACARQVFFPEGELMRVLSDELRVETEGRAHVTSRRGELVVTRPCAGCGRDGEREDAEPFALFDGRRVIGVEIEVTVKVDEDALGHEGPARTPVSNAPTSARPRW